MAYVQATAVEENGAPTAVNSRQHSWNSQSTIILLFIILRKKIYKTRNFYLFFYTSETIVLTL
jgi:hypothetical protein